MYIYTVFYSKSHPIVECWQPATPRAILLDARRAILAGDQSRTYYIPGVVNGTTYLLNAINERLASEQPQVAVTIYPTMSHVNFGRMFRVAKIFAAIEGNVITHI